MFTTQHDNQNDNAIRIHFYSVIESPANAVLAAARTLCSRDEHEAIARYASDTLRHRARLTRCVARHTLAQYLKAPANVLQFATTNNGKPYLTYPESTQWVFSITHTPTWVAIAVGQALAVGVDLEDLPARPGVAHDIRNLLTPAETTWLDADTQDDQASDLRATQLWTIKEALLKCHGTGLLVPASTITARLEGTPPTVTAIHEPPGTPWGSPRRWAIAPLPDQALTTLSRGHRTPLGAGCVAALVTAHRPVTGWQLHPHRRWWGQYVDSPVAFDTPHTEAEPIVLRAAPSLLAT